VLCVLATGNIVDIMVVLACWANLLTRLYILPSVISFFFKGFSETNDPLNRFSRFFHQMIDT